MVSNTILLFVTGTTILSLLMVGQISLPLTHPIPVGNLIMTATPAPPNISTVTAAPIPTTPTPEPVSAFVSVTEVKDWVETSKAIAEIIAIIVAGWWTYRLFVKKRVDYPYPRIEHRITHWPLEEGKLYL